MSNKEKIMKQLIDEGIIKFNEFIAIRDKLIDIDFIGVDLLDDETIDNWRG